MKWNLFQFFFHFLGTNRYFSRVAATQMGIEISFVDASDLSKLKNAIKPNTKVNILIDFITEGSYQRPS